jgi:DtxR family Mn-dependent transcriptional regulator
MIPREVEEVLEKIWICSEQNEHRVSILKERSQVKITPEILDHLEKLGLIAYTDNEVLLTFEGKKRASGIIRRHRLAERLLNDVLNMDINAIEPRACEFEHLIAEEVTDSICTLLGHPRECPHGKSIPEGKCCHEARTTVENGIISLDRLEVGQRARIAYLRTKNHARLHKLISFGLTPGVKAQVHQKFPTYVIKCEGTELAMEKEMLADVFVWRDAQL